MGADPSRNALLASILTRATTDADFRRRLLAEPERAIHEAFGVRVVDGFRVRFIEKDPDLDALVVLPDARSADEMSDEDLDAVAGGSGNGFTDAMWMEPPP